MTLTRSLPGLIAVALATPAVAADPVSFSKQVRPVLQAKCQGCHQPAKAQGGYVMTEFTKLLAAGDSGKVAIVAGKPGDSELVKQITPGKDGKTAMPKAGPALHPTEAELIVRWVKEGAKDDSPPTAANKYDADHPPVYTRPPVIAAVDYSPDGTRLAVAGFHEVLLTDPEAGKLVARLVGLSERVQSVCFSPDGKRLAVAGGSPGRFGELQVWDVAKGKLLLSKAVGYDTLYGASWSPDGKLLAVGCPDNTVRAFDATTGEQVLQQGTHTDWVLGTAFNPKGTHVVSVGRDMTVKLTEVVTQRFIDNVTSITPGALKGGVQAVARHPERDEIVVGGADGTPKVYRLFRTTARKIGDDANLIKQLPSLAGRVFDVAVSRDGKHVAAGSALDNVGQLLIAPYPAVADKKAEARIKAIEEKEVDNRTPAEREELVKLRAANPTLDKPVTVNVPAAGVYTVAFRPDGKAVAAAGSDGVVRVFDATSGKSLNEFSPAPVLSRVARHQPYQSPDFIKDVAPVLSRLGCNAGTCHGAQAGKNGFKLSLRGYDAVFDIRALTDDLASRRVNVAAPDDSLMLLKTTGAVPHAGGQLITADDPYYKLMRGWIAAGAKVNPNATRVAKIDLSPANPVVEMAGQTQPFKVIATYTDGTTRDVTKETFVESGNPDVATAAPRGGVLTAARRGEAPVLARYEGAYAATTLTVMGDRAGFTWTDPPKFNRIDELTAAKWKRLKTQPSDLCSDLEFVRRVYLDLTGLPPSADDVRAFQADDRDSQIKRDALVDKLIGSKEYIEFWTNKWADLLQVNRKFLGAEGSVMFRKWIREHVEKNTPYDRFVREVLTATGSNKDNPAAAYFKILRDPAATMENTTHLFLGVRFNCNKCHDHPFERWTQDQYYQLAAYFARVRLSEDPKAKGMKIGGTAVEGAKPLYEVVADRADGEVKHDRTGAVTQPKFPYPLAADKKLTPAPTRRAELADWLASPANPYFARSYANRTWGYLFGVGIIEPIDDIRAGNPATNPELLDFLTNEFVKSGFDVRHLHRLVCKSRTYQLSVASNRWNADDKTNFSHATARRLPAEVLYDAVHKAVGAVSKIPGVPAGTRAAELPDAGIDLPSRFLGEFGRPVRESACECERTGGLQLGPVMALVNGQTVADAINDPANSVAKLALEIADDDKLVNELFLRVLNRPATRAEIAACKPMLRAAAADNDTLTAALKVREAEVAPVRRRQEIERHWGLAKAKGELTVYQKELAPKLAEAEKQRQAKIAAADKAVADYDKTKLPAKLAAFEKTHAGDGVKWTVLRPATLKTTGGSKLNAKLDGSILVTEKNGKGNYTVTFPTDLTGITAIRLEALSDAKLPGGGPGRANNGNFVLNQFTVTARAKGGETTPVLFGNAVADFSQEGFDVKGASDGSPNGGKGWAVVPNTGVTHWAVFETKQPVGAAGGTTLTVTLSHNFALADHTVGRFRVSVTTAKPPVALGLSEDYRLILATPADKRDARQTAALAKYLKTQDPEFAKRTQAAATARQPLPPDPKLVELQGVAAALAKPLAEDGKLVQLRKDVEYSTLQAKAARLTGAQDIAWALINSPAFLFNR